MDRGLSARTPPAAGGTVATDAPSYRVLAAAGHALAEAGIPYVLVGGLASAALGRPRSTDDVDLLVAPGEATDALKALGDAGFETEETNPYWIFKAQKDGVIVDVIFAMKGGIHLDAEMVERSRDIELYGVPVRVAAPEDVIVSKAVAHDEPSAHHWGDALGMIAEGDLDWDYLLVRAQHGARRVLSLLVYAQADDLVVPDWAIAYLFRTIYEPVGSSGGSGD